MLPLTTNQDLDALAKKMKIKNYKGVYMRDETLPPLKLGKYVFNLDNEDSTGTHWVGLIVTAHGKNNLYFDSFGMNVPEEIKEWAKSLGDDLYYSTIPVQDDTSSSCGYFVLRFLKYIQDSKSKQLNAYSDFVHKNFTNDTKQNEKKLAEYFTR